MATTTYNIPEAIKAQEQFATRTNIRALHRTMVSVGTAIRISIPKMEEPDTVRKHMVFRWKVPEII